MNLDERATVDRIMSQANRKIWVTFQREGIHRYPAAATDPLLATGDWCDVSFLAHPHRHIFHFYVNLEVSHNDRDVEFILFKRELEALFESGAMQADYKSCEMMAEEVLGYIETEYPGRMVQVEVFEDDENGAILSNA